MSTEQVIGDPGDEDQPHPVADIAALEHIAAAIDPALALQRIQVLGQRVVEAETARDEALAQVAELKAQVPEAPKSALDDIRAEMVTQGELLQEIYTVVMEIKAAQPPPPSSIFRDGTGILRRRG